MLTLKELKKNVEALGINFETWRKEEVDKALIKLIRNDKEKDYYSKWELQQLNVALYQLLINRNESKAPKQPQNQSHQQQHQKNKNQQAHQKVENKPN
ncbi:hypothetical protein MWQ88_001747 [Staphylococcus pseudintermedius]|uniref:hypothetical protein n=1 Tax=Staphylococcus pseudintermedius TaxID=283734 RepID=UPI0008096A87|nr:hypothetical protein [Staphylococcus pseudintermedius]ANS90087.1 hypothetical protein A6M57_8855 [Staphylococcus pseudintermedius]EGQ0310585.1 hypothetical protein [Staphylococcus pseudintermedius]EGQ0359613.1 hypothetical protein [Staphylococcus pseudintermedius]EGQ0372995.1 hypothetical protein [Staphylococcus pseudintermedius]EGQ1279030.1 hypothetical protein [Staphylococcus pseudintermedius]